jgi:hypothetical protein
MNADFEKQVVSEVEKGLLGGWKRSSEHMFRYEREGGLSGKVGEVMPTPTSSI